MQVQQLMTLLPRVMQMTQRFRNEPGLRVALLSVTAAGTGLDFSAASLVVFAELPAEVCDGA